MPTPDLSSPAPTAITAGIESTPGSIRLRLCGRKWLLYRPADLESLWEAMTEETFAADERLPYWVELWPASLALGLWLQQEKSRIAGKRCLDLGCGLGLTAQIGTWLGARVLAVDYEPEALAYARKNALANAVPSPLWTVMDWRRPALAAGSLDYIWGGDILYENRFVTPVFDCIDHSLSERGAVWIAEPGRDAYDAFRRALLSRGWRARCVARHKVESPHVRTAPVPVKLWELTRS